jgi:hypothetical protein
LLPSVLKLQGFVEGEAANPHSAGEFAAARRALGNSARPYPLAERRKRARHATR